MPRAIALLTSAAVAIALAACGGSSGGSAASSGSSSAASSTPAQASSTASGTAGQPSGTSSIAADPSGNLKFTKSSLTAKAGKVTIQFTNGAALPHNLTIQQGTGGKVIGATPTFQGGSKTLTVNLKPGTYTFYCSVPGHRQAGMQGTLTVR
jgi:uncharacterized cupredoxin-like copper-binding protein